MDLIKILESLSVSFEKTPFEEQLYTCNDVALSLGILPEQVAKAMLVEIKNKGYCIAVIPGNYRLDISLLKDALNDAKISLVHFSKIEKAIGLPVGAVTPLIYLINPSIEIIIEKKLLELNKINISSGDLKMGINIAVSDLAKLTTASFNNISFVPSS